MSIPDRSPAGLPRAFEVVLAVVGLMLFSPLMAIAALAVRFSSPGPVLFRQERVGVGGEHFTLLKFRTMRVQNSGLQVTACGDSRVTPIGKLLRKTKIDELPELWNVFRGGMSFVGPRPEVPCYVDLRNAAWRRVLAVRPGITDPVTVRLRNEEDLLARAANEPEDFYLRVLQPYKLRGYEEYLVRRSAQSDFRVLVETLIALIRPTKAKIPEDALIGELQDRPLSQS